MISWDLLTNYLHDTQHCVSWLTCVPGSLRPGLWRKFQEGSGRKSLSLPHRLSSVLPLLAGKNWWHPPSVITSRGKNFCINSNLKKQWQALMVELTETEDMGDWKKKKKKRNYYGFCATICIIETKLVGFIKWSKESILLTFILLSPFHNWHRKVYLCVYSHENYFSSAFFFLYSRTSQSNLFFQSINLYGSILQSLKWKHMSKPRVALWTSKQEYGFFFLG